METKCSIPKFSEATMHREQRKLRGAQSVPSRGANKKLESSPVMDL